MDKSINKITRMTAVQMLPVLKRLMWIFPIDSYAPVNLFLLFVTCIKDYTKFIILPYPPFFKEKLYFLKKQRKLRILDDKATQKERLHSKSGVRFRRV